LRIGDVASKLQAHVLLFIRQHFPYTGISGSSYIFLVGHLPLRLGGGPPKIPLEDGSEDGRKWASRILEARVYADELDPCSSVGRVCHADDESTLVLSGPDVRTKVQDSAGKTTKGRPLTSLRTLSLHHETAEPLPPLPNLLLSDKAEN
jgi:hypothetical protein